MIAHHLHDLVADHSVSDHMTRNPIAINYDKLPTEAVGTLG